MNSLTLKFFDPNIQFLYSKNQQQHLSINRQLISAGLLLIGLGYLCDSLFIDKNFRNNLEVVAIIFATSICLMLFQRFVIKYFSLIITILVISLVLLDLIINDQLQDAYIRKHLWQLYNKGVLVMLHLIVALTCIPEWYLKTAIVASYSQFLFVYQLYFTFYDNFIQLQVIFILASSCFYFQEKREKKIFYTKCIKKKELQSWKQMLDSLVPVSVFVIDKDQQKQNNTAVNKANNQTKTLNLKNIAGAKTVYQNKMNIEFINKTCLKTFDISSKEQFEEKLRNILVKKRYTVNQQKKLTQKQEVNTTKTIQQQQALSPLHRTNPLTLTSFNRNDNSQNNQQFKKNKNKDLEIYSKNLFKIIFQLRNQNNTTQQTLQTPLLNQNKNNLLVDNISLKSNNNTMQLQLQPQLPSNTQLENVNELSIQANTNVKQYQFLNCKYIIPKEQQRKNENEPDKKIQHYDIKLIECMWNGNESIIGVITDVSEQVIAERRQEMMSYKNSVMNTITHDLKTPLNGIQLILSSTLEGKQSSEKDLKESINSALTQGHLLESRINDLLDYSKLLNSSQQNIDKVRVNVDNFDINESIIFCLTLHQQSAIKKGINLFFNHINIHQQDQTHLHIPLACQNDRQRFQQILINLIGNALKFTFEGSVKVLTEVLDNNDLKISVVDTGIGMSQGVMMNLQDKSEAFQFDATSSEKKNLRHGFGLGLDISKRLIRLISREDSLSVNSEQNQGTNITFQIPLNYEYQQIQLLGSYNQVQSEISSTSALLSIDNIKMCHNIVPIFSPKFIFKTQKQLSIRVMIVDDTSFNIIALQKFIQKIHGDQCDVDVAYNGLQAVNIYKKRLQQQRNKQPFEKIVFHEAELHNKCDISEFEYSILSDNILDDDNFSSDLNSGTQERQKKRTSVGRRENLNSKSPYDIIFMDLNMPVMDGYQAISSIRSLERNYNMQYISFIAVVTAFGEECDKQNSLDIGADYHITKPLKQELLKQIFDNCYYSLNQQKVNEQNQ